MLLMIPTFNNYTYLKNTIDRFQNIVDDIMVMDNNSTYEPMKDYLLDISDDIQVKWFKENHGPRRYYNDKWFYWDLPYHFIVTDPDLEFDDGLDRDAIDHLVELSDQLGAYKVGSALSLDMEADNVLDDEIIFSDRKTTVREIESAYYSNNIGVKTKYGDNIYSAYIDSTFAVYNRLHEQINPNLGNYRVDGVYLAKHYGWLRTQPIPQDEAEYYTESTAGLPYASGEVTKRGDASNY